MGKKLNPQYREYIANRTLTPKCAFCGRRRATVRHENRWLHKSCVATYTRYQREAHLAATIERDWNQALIDDWSLAAGIPVKEQHPQGG